MKANLLRKYILPGAVGLASGLALTAMAGPGIIIVPPSPPSVVISAPVPAPPTVVVSAPAPAVTVVPDDYYYDGTEYVGVVNGQYYYLGPGNAWVVMDAPRLHRFNVWVGAHPDWRTHYVTHNVMYRGNGPGHFAQPMHEDHAYDHSDYNHSDHDHNGPPH